MKERIKGRKNFPTEEVDSNNFLSDNDIRKLINKSKSFKFSQEDFDRLFNCVHCGECETEPERFLLKQKFVDDGNTFDEKNEMLEYFHKYRSPYPTNKMRIKTPDGIPSESDTLLFMGCLFKTYIKPKMKTDLEIKYISDYIKPSKEKHNGRIAVQHLCQLMNRGKEGIDTLINASLKKSGYEIVDVPHWCCGGGTGWMGRTSIIESVARKRMSDFNRDDIDYVTTYCPSCWWILRRFSKLCKIKPKAKDLFELLL